MAAAHGYTIPGSSLDATGRVRRWRPSRRACLLLAVSVALLVVVTAPSAVQTAATELCTTGTPSGTTCGEALYLLGYP